MPLAIGAISRGNQLRQIKMITAIIVGYCSTCSRWCLPRHLVVNWVNWRKHGSLKGWFSKNATCVQIIKLLELI